MNNVIIYENMRLCYEIYTKYHSVSPITENPTLNPVRGSIGLSRNVQMSIYPGTGKDTPCNSGAALKSISSQSEPPWRQSLSSFYKKKTKKNYYL